MTELVYRLTQEFPAQERFGLASQLKRAAVSVPSCIAEGNARRSTRDYLRFLSMAAGSLAEIRTQLLLAIRLGMVDSTKAESCLASHQSVTRLLQATINSLKSKVAIDPLHRSPFPVPRSRA